MPEDKTTEKEAGQALEYALARRSPFAKSPVILRVPTPRRGSDSHTDRLYRNHIVTPGDKA